MKIDNTVTIQQTSKKWKGLQVLAGLILILGPFLSVIMALTMHLGDKYPHDFVVDAFRFAVICFVSGIILNWIARFGAWWNHG